MLLSLQKINKIAHKKDKCWLKLTKRNWRWQAHARRLLPFLGILCRLSAGNLWIWALFWAKMCFSCYSGWGLQIQRYIFCTENALKLTKSKTSKGKPRQSFKNAYAERWFIMIAVDDVILVCLYICRECLCNHEVFWHLPSHIANINQV